MNKRAGVLRIIIAMIRISFIARVTLPMLDLALNNGFSAISYTFPY
ncbi:MAG TPA: hypothetical protein VGP06_02850 [Janthinobacterium sp.]|jgi:hypothetical protein|nr:hypothetical protein [Janthinobacterium sp.]